MSQEQIEEVRGILAPLMAEMRRDTFAAHALAGMLARPNSSPDSIPGITHKSAQHYALTAFEFADAMMDARGTA